MKCLNVLLLTTAIGVQAYASPNIAFVFKYDTDPMSIYDVVMSMHAKNSLNDDTYQYEAYAYDLYPGQDHRDTISKGLFDTGSPYGTYKIRIWCERDIKGKHEGQGAERIVNIPQQGNKLQTVTVRAVCSVDKNNILLPPSNIQVIGPY